MVSPFQKGANISSVFVTQIQHWQDHWPDRIDLVIHYDADRNGACAHAMLTPCWKACSSPIASCRNIRKRDMRSSMHTHFKHAFQSSEQPPCVILCFSMNQVTRLCEVFTNPAGPAAFKKGDTTV